MCVHVCTWGVCVCVCPKICRMDIGLQMCYRGGQECSLASLADLKFNLRPEKETKFHTKAVTSESAVSGMLARFFPGTPKEGVERPVGASEPLRTKPQESKASENEEQD